MTVTEANALKHTQTLSVLSERVNSDAETAAANNLATTKALTTHTELILTNTELIKSTQEHVAEHVKDIKALKDKYEWIEKQVEGGFGEVAIKTKALTNTTEIHHERLNALFGTVGWHSNADSGVLRATSSELRKVAGTIATSIMHASDGMSRKLSPRTVTLVISVDGPTQCRGNAINNLVVKINVDEFYIKNVGCGSNSDFANG